MESELLSEFYSRYPSALGNSRAGGLYRVICLRCGEFIAVPVPEEHALGIDVTCASCGWHDHIGAVEAER